MTSILAWAILGGASLLKTPLLQAEMQGVSSHIRQGDSQASMQGVPRAWRI